MLGRFVPAMSIARFQSRRLEPDSVEPAATTGPKLHVVTFGCQMNKYDSLRVEGRFRRDGWSTTDDVHEADAVLFNTCSVRDHAEERVWSWLGELKRARARRPDLVIGVMGCMAQRVEEEIFRRAGHVDLVVGTRAFHHVPELVEQVRARRRGGDGAPQRAASLAMDGSPDGRPEDEVYTGGRRGFLAVMRGCDLNCTFCIVPTVRGRVLSRPMDELVDEARWMIDQGAQVITLLGQTVNSYGEDHPAPGPGERRHRGRQGRPGLADLLYRLQELDGLERIRLITLHPSYVTEALARALADCDKCDRFLPLPAQSGSDRVLKAMKRGYTTDLYRRRVELLRQHVPDIELGSDWIVGFPGETEQDLALSEAFLEEMGFVVNYVFKYDARPTTRAADRLEETVAEADKKARNQRLLACSERVALGRMQSHLGRALPAFVEEPSERRAGHLVARTHHNLPITFEGPAQLVGRSVRVLAEDATAFGLTGTLQEQPTR